MNTHEKVNRYSEMILDLIYNQDEFTTSDLQGVVQALVMRILAETGGLSTGHNPPVKKTIKLHPKFVRGAERSILLIDLIFKETPLKEIVKKFGGKAPYNYRWYKYCWLHNRKDTLEKYKANYQLKLKNYPLWKEKRKEAQQEMREYYNKTTS